MKNRQKGPVLTSKGPFYSFFLWITHFLDSFNNSFNRTAKIFIQRIYSFKKDPKLSIQIIHSFKKDPKLFIQRIYSFKKIQNYSFKENIHSSEKCIIAQGYRGVPLLLIPIFILFCSIFDVKKNEIFRVKGRFTKPPLNLESPPWTLKRQLKAHSNAF